MPAILTPALALRYLRQLSTDVRAAIVLGADGRPLAGEEALAAPAAALAALLPAGARELVVRVEAGGAPRGSALVVRTPASPAVAAVAGPGAAGPDLTLVLAVGPLALLDLLRHDAETVAQALADAPTPAAALPSLPPGAVVVGEASRCVQMSQAGEFPVQTAISAGMGLFDAVAAANVAPAR
jgi:hypothetical protein